MQEMISWNPWHGCTKLSEGCKNCYVYRLDKMYGRDPSVCKPTGNLDMMIKKDRRGKYKVPSNSKVMLCFTSDFLLEDADKYRDIVWKQIRERKDCTYMFITKRIDRLEKCLPSYWNEIKNLVNVCCTVENQKQADYRIPILLKLPLEHRSLCCEPLLEELNLFNYLETGIIEHITIGGESGSKCVARPCNYKWVKRIVDDCNYFHIDYWFKQTGTHFIDEDGIQEIIYKHGNQYKRASMYNFYTKPLANLGGNYENV